TTYTTLPAPKRTRHPNQDNSTHHLLQFPPCDGCRRSPPPSFIAYRQIPLLLATPTTMLSRESHRIIKPSPHHGRCRPPLTPRRGHLPRLSTVPPPPSDCTISHYSLHN
ncbi:unnamed protein product, partial [Sphacelaria rigidula]